MFDDVPASSPYCPWIEELARRGITVGCDENNFCPGEQANRAQTATFIVRTLGEADWHNVGEPGEPVFGDPAAPDCEWSNFIFEDSETQTGSVGFRRDGDGFVHLKGIVKVTDIGEGQCQANFNEDGTGDPGFPPENTIFLLPEGYRPVRATGFAVLTNHQLGRITVLPATENNLAAVIVNIPTTFANASAWISLDGISFPLDD